MATRAGQNAHWLSVKGATRPYIKGWRAGAVVKSALVDTTAPVVGSFVPVTPSAINLSTALQCDITDNISIARRVVWVSYASGRTEIIYNGSAFTSAFTAGSSWASITGGYRLIVARTGGWLGAPTLHFDVYDTGGNVASPASAVYTLNGGQSPGPIISNISPAEGADLEIDDVLSFDITSPSGLLAADIIITAEYLGLTITDVVYVAGAFGAKFAGVDNDTDVISNGFNFTVLRDGRWPAAPTFRVYVVDNDDQQLSDTLAWDLDAGESVAPSISGFSPAPGTGLDSETPIEFDITDPSGLLVVAVMVTYPTLGTAELAYDGNQLRGSYADEPNLVTTISNGKHFKLVRADGWPARPRVEWLVVDNEGNLGEVSL